MRYSQRARLLANGIQSGFHVSEIKCPANSVSYFKFVCSLFLQSFPNQFSSLEILDLSNNMIENVEEMVSSTKEEIRVTHFFRVGYYWSELHVRARYHCQRFARVPLPSACLACACIYELHVISSELILMSSGMGWGWIARGEKTQVTASFEFLSSLHLLVCVVRYFPSCRAVCKG